MCTFKSVFRLVVALGLVLSLSALAVPPRAALAAIYTWNGGTGDWNVATNWTPNGVPGSNDTVAINGGTVNVTGDVTVQDLTLSSGTLQGSAALTVTNGMTWTNGTLSGSGATTIANGATLNVQANGDCVYVSGVQLTGRTLNVAGTATLTGTNALCAQSGTINNSGLFDVVSDVNVFWNGGSSAVLNNTGALRKSGGGGTSTWSSIIANNDGSLQVLSGTLRLSKGGTSSGSYAAAAGATLDFGGGTHTISLTAANSISGGGTMRFSNGTTTIGGSGSYAVAGNTDINGGTLNVNLDATTAKMTFSGGTLQGSSSLTVTQVMTWTGGTQSGSGATTIADGATLTVTANGDCVYTAGTQLRGRTLNIAGAGILTGTNSLCAESGTINNSGLFDMVSDVNVFWNGGSSAVLNNTGALRKSGGGGTSAWSSIAVNNAGSLEALSGILRLSGFAQNSGVTMLNGGALSKSSGTFNFYGGMLQGAGIITGNVANVGGTVSPGMSPGVLHIAGNYTQGPTGTLNIELGGVVSGTQYDVLDVTGAASLSGILNVSLINSFAPISGTVFRIVNFSTRSGDFITETGMNVGGWLFLLPYYSSDHLSLIVGTTMADLGISVTDGKSYAIAGDPITYTIVVTNAGPDVANGAVVTDTLPGIISNVTWTCVTSGGSCGALSGSGNLSTTVNLNAGGMVTFTLGGRLSLSATGTLINTAYVSHPTDPDPGNNSATDSDLVLYIKMYVPLAINQ